MTAEQNLFDMLAGVFANAIVALIFRKWVTAEVLPHKGFDRVSVFWLSTLKELKNSSERRPPRKRGIFYTPLPGTGKGWCFGHKAGSGLIEYPQGEYARRSLTVFGSRPFFASRERPTKNSERCPMSQLSFDSSYLFQDLNRCIARLGFLTEYADLAVRFCTLTTPQNHDTQKAPNSERPCRSLCQCPHAGTNRGVFCFCHHNASYGVSYELAEQRPVSVRTGGHSEAGERCFAFFF